MVKENTAGKEMRLKKVFICSPFRPEGRTDKDKKKDWEQNIETAQEACGIVLERGGIPYAPHLYFPQFLSEEDTCERRMGILLGLTWLAQCDEMWVIGDRVSEGMKQEIAKAGEWDIPVRRFVRRKKPEERLLAAIFNDIRLF